MITAAQARLHAAPDQQDQEEEQFEISSTGSPHNSDDDREELAHDGSAPGAPGERGSRRRLAGRCTRLRYLAQRDRNRRPRRLTPMETHDEEEGVSIMDLDRISAHGDMGSHIGSVGSDVAPSDASFQLSDEDYS